MMARIDLTNHAHALHRRLVADMAAQRVTGVGRIHDDAAAARTISAAWRINRGCGLMGWMMKYCDIVLWELELQRCK